jgi:hypothetical protein
MSHESALEDVTPLHIGNIRAIPSTDARIKLMNLPKEQSQLNGLSATVLSQAAAKSSSGAIKARTPTCVLAHMHVTGFAVAREVGYRWQAREHPRVDVPEAAGQAACRKQHANGYLYSSS